MEEEGKGRRKEEEGGGGLEEEEEEEGKRGGERLKHIKMKTKGKPFQKVAQCDGEHW